jgi:hypothetical protein
MTAALPPPGWYPDPDGTPQRLRWWNGVQWSGSTKPVDVPVPGTADEVSAGTSPSKAVWWLTGGAVALVVVLFVAAVLVWGTTGSGGDTAGPGGSPNRSAPPLVALCPPPSDAAEAPGGAVPPAPAGRRVVDSDAGISYAGQPAPWQPWDQGTWAGGDLGVEFRQGYYFVTEQYIGGDYLASVLSGAVPATVNDGLTLDLECAGRQVAEDVRRSFYPAPNTKKVLRDAETTVGGRPAWVSVFRLAFSTPGLKARSELVAVVMVDVGRPTAAVLYLSIPETHEQYEPVIDDVIESIRPI